MSDELIPINILIGDRTYRIKSLSKDEEIIRKTLKIINDKIIEFKTQFAGKDTQDYIAMVLIWYATQAPSSGNSQHIEAEFMEALSKIEHQIDKAL
ncbi:MAG: cell division protein ZapA [Bacteroidota bacterium]|nr:cell division protein ZapA [Bacteroidota bacterium]